MNKRLIALALIAFGSVLLAAGGGCAVEAGPVTVVCLDDNAACNFNADCCSDLCAADGFCGLPLDGCLEDNVACADPAECCSGVCAPDGYCGLP